MSNALAALPPQVGGLYADHSYKLVITTVVSFVIATFGILGRFAARYICKKRLELNDYFILLGYTMKLGLTILSSLLISYGIGRHVYIIAPETLTSYLKATWTGSFIYAPIITFIKLSILSLYYNAFPSRFMKVGVYILAAITTAWGIALCLVGLLACLPIEKSWNPTMDGTCINIYEYYYGLQIPNIVTDFAILFLPFKDIYALDLPLKRLLQIGGVLALGLVTCIIDIVRLVVFLEIPTTSMDITWIQLAPSMWLDLEASIAILCACLPVMRPLLHPKRFFYQARMTYPSRQSAGEQSYDDGEELQDRSEKAVHAIASHERDGSASSTSQRQMRDGEDFPSGQAV